ncbi:MAG: M48 family metallopeptidase [Acidobacteria bacterium]|nr:M48 family metallopeptidase [Acidobacteriota bacterium]MBV9478190.1 M48 family metallopeptidase [Acidobacteriota bacterium]
MRKLILALATVAVAATAVVAVAASARQPPEPARRDPRFEVKVTDEIRRHSRIEETLYFAGTAYSLGVLVLLLASGAAPRMRDLSLRLTKKPFVVAMLTVVLFVLATTLLELPLTYYADFVVPHQFDLSDQSLGSWLLDGAKGLAVSLVLSAIVGALALEAIRRYRRWWLVLWLGSIPLILLMVVVQPIVLDPIFNKFEPLQNQQLKTKLLDLASRAGIEGGRVYQVNKSKQTKTMNAYVNGIGPTKRIVLWDTLLAKMTDDEILAVMGHEMGHYVLNHMWKGLGFGLAISFVVFFAGQKIYDRGIETRGARWGLTGRGDPASLPWLLLIAGVIGFFLSPVTNGFSRHIEHEADVFSLDLTHLNEPMARAFVKFAEDSKRDPDPNRFLECWRYSHPALGRRIDFALAYKPWEERKTR